jgi:hypothetical protein
VHGPSTVDDPTVDVGTEVNLTDIVVLQNCFVARVGGVVSSTVIDGATCNVDSQLLLSDLESELTID